jgi:dihydroflavonol-4-reductase
VRVLVTGATGFVGGQLAAALVRRGDAVRVLRREHSSLVALEELPVEEVIGDILDPLAVARAVDGCEVVYHVAALSSYWRAVREQIYRVNVEGTRTVLAACLAAGVRRVVHTSSVGALGVPRNGRPADENTPFDPALERFPYGHSKYLAEQEVQAAVQRGLNAVIVNPAVVIGPGDHYLISGSIIVEMARRPLPAVPPGGVCMTDVDAVVAGHIAAAERGRVGERYILGGENLTYRQIAATVMEIVGRRAPRRTLPGWVLPPAAAVMDSVNRVSRRPPLMSGEQIRLSAHNAFFSSEKARRELDYPILPFRDAAARAYRWYAEHGYLK